jgi:hypothetical protein
VVPFGHPFPRGRRRKDARMIRSTEDGLTIETNEYCEQIPEEREEMVFDDDGNLVPLSHHKPERKKSTVVPLLRTGIDLEREKSTERPSGWQQGGVGRNPQPGMLLRHPDYGVGFIRNVFGPSSSRIANIEFLSGAGMVDLPLDDPQIDIFWGKKS